MITSSCLVCHRPCVLQQWGSRSWVHEDEEIIVGTSPPSIDINYDHEAQPDILDLEGEEL